MPIVMATGQAAGVTAALAARKGVVRGKSMSSRCRANWCGKARVFAKNPKAA